MVRDHGITGNLWEKILKKSILFLQAFLSARDNPTWIKQLQKIQGLNIILITAKIIDKTTLS